MTRISYPRSRAVPHARLTDEDFAQAQGWLTNLKGN
jgi:hypothetical protein